MGASKTLAAFVADHHSGGGYIKRGVDDSHFSMAQIANWAESHKVKWLVLLGDNIDRERNLARAVVPLTNQLMRINEAGTKIGFIQGNHDLAVPPWLSSKDFYWLDRQPVEIGGRVWFGLDFRPREEILQILAEEIPPDVTGLLMHQTWSNFMGDVAAPQCGFEDVPDQIKRVATGDYHGEALIANFKGKGGQTIKVANPGTTSMQDISEPDKKFFVALMDDGLFKLVPLKTRVVLRSDILHTVNDMEKFVGEVGQAIDVAVAQATADKYPEELYKPLLQVTYSHSIPDALRRIERVVKDRAHLFPKEIKPEKVTRSYKTNLAAANGKAFTAAMLLKEEINPDSKDNTLDKEAYVLAEKLLSCKNKEEVQRAVLNWRELQMKEEG